ncbi:hypothetical protein, partial [Myxococcus sp. AM009]|uniref:hypothetical protein n=1 Tax=Myxococcus sp. AM009 TaxID=2745137 RepID=UPI001C3C5036
MWGIVSSHLFRRIFPSGRCPWFQELRTVTTAAALLELIHQLLAGGRILRTGGGGAAPTGPQDPA